MTIPSSTLSPAAEPGHLFVVSVVTAALRPAAGRLRWRALPMALMLALGCGLAQAGLFDDEEARKAILDLRARIQAGSDEARNRAVEQDKVTAALAEQVKQLQQLQSLRRSVLDLNDQLEAQRADNAKLRGTQEQLARDLAEAQRRLKDASTSLDARLRPLEPQKVALDGKEFVAEPDEKRSHDQAMAVLRGGDFDKAAPALAGFLQRYSGSGYTDSVRFWLGNAYYGQRNYKEAISSFRALVTTAPGHPRAPEALLAVANCQIEMKDNKAARRTLDELGKAYPGTDAATAAKERLSSLKG